MLGARTQKYADYLDICAALTGRAPLAGCHLDEHRRPSVVIDASELLEASADSSFFPLMGYLCGLRAEAQALLHSLVTSPTYTIDW